MLGPKQEQEDVELIQSVTDEKEGKKYTLGIPRCLIHLYPDRCLGSVYLCRAPN